MKTIEYRATWAEGQQRIVQVKARNINAGLGLAIALAVRLSRKMHGAELHSVEFWQVLCA
jgi:hypothetical protein